MKVFLLPLALAFSAIGVSNASAAESAICQDPVKFICENRVVNPATDIAKKISELAANEVNRFLGSSYPATTFVHDLRAQLAYLPVYRGMDAASGAIVRGLLYVACSDYLTRAYFSDRSSEHTCFQGVLEVVPGQAPPTFDSILNRIADEDHFEKVNKVIRDAKQFVGQSLAASSLSTELKSLLQDKLDATKPVSILKFLREQLQFVDPARATRIPGILADLIDTCDLDLKSLNAFNYSMGYRAAVMRDTNQNGLVICPSLWVNGMQDVTRGEGSFVFSVLAHEVGHTVEREILALTNPGPAAPALQTESKKKYDGVISCMKDRYVTTNSLTIRYPEFRTQAIKASFMNALDFRPNEKIPDLYFDEYSADVISSKALALYLAQYQTLSKRIDIVKRSADFLCEVKEHDPLQSPKFKGNDLHPSGAFRIREDYFSNEDLRRVLGCTPREASTNCSLL
jgi:hypothetical protein